MSRPKMTKAEIQEALEGLGAIAEMCVVFLSCRVKCRC